MQALVEPVASKLKSFEALTIAAVGSGVLFNVLLPDQYPAIALSCKMYGDAFSKRPSSAEAWANIINSSAGITSVLIPWNTCAIYMVTVLGVPCAEYAPYAFFCYLYPLAVVLMVLLLGKRLGWSESRSHTSEVVSKTQQQRKAGLRTQSA
ncbi:Na+/H+ antiporter NhaC family protein [Collinsella provencensis]|uniref:Na+/H+ antiporter NhaC family protein n=1 Tax=Collinsella provencensis TaxID=1937461 RepID=UPI000C8625E8|nr:Na+/H+ antiporter NhaC family protein [Collinsella provencensis]